MDLLRKLSVNNGQAVGGGIFSQTQPTIYSPTGWSSTPVGNTQMWSPTGAASNSTNTSVSSNIGSNDVSKLQQNPNMPGWLAQLLQALQRGGVR